MANYSVKQIADMLDTNPETVRRWIRSGKLQSTQTSKKEGNVVSEEALKAFLEGKPKYASAAMAGVAAGVAAAVTPMIGLPAALGLAAGAAGGWSAQHTLKQIHKKTEQNPEVEQCKKMLVQQLAEIERMEEELQRQKQKLKELETLLNRLDPNDF